MTAQSLPRAFSIISPILRRSVLLYFICDLKKLCMFCFNTTFIHDRECFECLHRILESFQLFHLKFARTLSIDCEPISFVFSFDIFGLRKYNLAFWLKSTKLGHMREFFRDAPSFNQFQNFFWFYFLIFNSKNFEVEKLQDQNIIKSQPLVCFKSFCQTSSLRTI